ncbi:TetR/AcrR family transcriptional regulator [uncultured Endozoicomonas sp.]|uniref:TetR/AcrR family transcriptional regulator n=1 Tax=uncultured Endozoicomonas sp. TaxID=432652 RepID=UPI0026252E57|nr:TetR/AcrR family transcriptional regulator [uncultured Endozoicomonas sp.]
MQPAPPKKDQEGFKNSRVRQKNIQVILEAAEEEFVASGYKGASIRDIAHRAGLPKANVHYYFNSKIELYSAVLSHIMELWQSVFSGLDPEDEPGTAFRKFIHAKMKYVVAHSKASRIFSSEILHGAQHLKEHMHPFNDWIQEKSEVIRGWIAQGKMKSVDPVHLLFSIWATTQYYADYSAQVAFVLGKETLSEQDIESYTDSVCQIILVGVGLDI